jgi:hypothetical protein
MRSEGGFNGRISEIGRPTKNVKMKNVKTKSPRWIAPPGAFLSKQVGSSLISVWGT